jgi:hypothetical protein
VEAARVAVAGTALPVSLSVPAMSRAMVAQPLSRAGEGVTGSWLQAMSVLSPAARIREITFGSAATAPAGSRAVTPVSLVIALGGGHFDPKPFGGHRKLHGLDDTGRRDAKHLRPQLFVVHAFSSAFSYGPSLPRKTTRFPGEPEIRITSGTIRERSR